MDTEQLDFLIKYRTKLDKHYVPKGHQSTRQSRLYLLTGKKYAGEVLHNSLLLIHTNVEHLIFACSNYRMTFGVNASLN